MRELNLKEMRKAKENFFANPDLSDRDKEEGWLDACAEIARDRYDIVGFDCFMQLIFGHELPDHFIDPLKDYLLGEEDGIIVEAHIESAKTTIWTKGLTMFDAGHFPLDSQMIIQVADGRAGETVQQGIADTLADNPRWKKAFPHIVPSTPWGKETGFQIRATAIKKDGVLTPITEAEWSELVDTEKETDPTIWGSGYNNRSIIGKRVSRAIRIDDINDENNSWSERERDNTNRRLSGPIMSRAKEGALLTGVGTPMHPEDALHKLIGMGLYKHYKIPAYTVVEEGTPGSFEWRGDTILPSWPEVVTKKWLDLKYASLGPADFARYVLLDLTKVSEDFFHYQAYRSERIKPHWIHGAGTDFASISKDAQRNDPNRAYFSMLYGCKTPDNEIVVTGGEHGRFKIDESEKLMVQAQDIHPNWRGNKFETDGKGEVFFDIVRRNAGLQVSQSPTKGQNKLRRIESLQPYLSNGIIKVSDADNPALNALRKFLNDYPYVKYYDVGDALWHLTRNFPEILRLPVEKTQRAHNYDKRKKRRSAYSSVGNHYG